jgi:hypothetical protein
LAAVPQELFEAAFADRTTMPMTDGIIVMRSWLGVGTAAGAAIASSFAQRQNASNFVQRSRLVLPKSLRERPK